MKRARRRRQIHYRFRGRVNRRARRAMRLEELRCAKTGEIPAHVMAVFERECRCCPCCQMVCAGVMAGGICDQAKCVREDDPVYLEFTDDEYEDEQDVDWR